jgi:hypothetical protein
VRLVDEDPVGDARRPALLAKRVECCDEIRLALLRRREREIDHEASEAVPDQPRQLVGKGKSASAPDRDDAAQATERCVVTLGIEDADGVAELDQALGEEPGGVGLARAAAARHQHAHLGGGKPHDLAFERPPQLDLPALRLDEQLAPQQRPAQQLLDAATVALAKDDVGVLLQALHRVLDRDPQLALLEERQVVLRVADRDRAVMGDAKLSERLEETRPLRDPGR